VVRSLADQMKGDYHGNIKSAESLARKVFVKRCEGRKYSVLSAKDHARAAIVIRANDLVRALNRLVEEGFYLEGSLEEPKRPFGYRGMFAFRSHESGLNQEVQIHTPASWNLKVATDPTYRYWRVFTEADIKSQPKARQKKFLAESERIRKKWTNYAGSLPEEIKSAIADSVRTSVLKRSPNRVPSGAGFQVFPPSVETQGPESTRARSRPSENLPTKGETVTGITPSKPTIKYRISCWQSQAKT